MNYLVLLKNGCKKDVYFSEMEYNKGDYVIVQSEKFQSYGLIVSKIDGDIDSENKNIILRKASIEDGEEYLNKLKDNMLALEKAREISKNIGLQMNILSAEFSFDGSQLLFMFTADDRIDFRLLARKLAGIYHTRIELRQVGTRDRAKEISGIGICGQKLCCSRFLTKMDTISMNMAKNQNLALNPTKINGVCGRLLCCLGYEDENYVELTKKLPKIGEEIEVEDKIGKVLNVNILKQNVKVMVEGEIKEIHFE